MRQSVSPTPGSDDLRQLSQSYADIFYDSGIRLILNPPGTESEIALPGSLHLVPNSCWYAYGLLQRMHGSPGASAVVEEATEILKTVLSLQLEGPGKPWNGTFRRFYEWPESPPDNALEWWDYDPNWRQFVSCSFALIIERFEDQLPLDLVRDLEQSIAIAVDAEPVGRIAAGYTNPRLMQVAASAWLGRRRADVGRLAWSETELEDIVARHRQVGGYFDEFNSPTYDGINLFALSILCDLDGLGSIQGKAKYLREVLWSQIDAFLIEGLGNIVGPFSRAYFADMNRYVSLAALWIWARSGVRIGPKFDFEPHLTLHGHDLMLGPLIADLADRWGPSSLSKKPSNRTVQIELGERSMTVLQFGTWALGVETSAGPANWVGSHQQMSFVLHVLEVGADVVAIWARTGIWQIVSSETRRLVLVVNGCSQLQAQGQSSCFAGPIAKFVDLTVVASSTTGEQLVWRSTPVGSELLLNNHETEIVVTW